MSSGPVGNIIKEIPLEPCSQTSFLFMSEDPRSGDGVNRGIGSFGFGPDGSLYRKIGPGNNDWAIALSTPDASGVSALKKTLTFTDEQIKALPGAALELIPAPGEGKVNFLLAASAIRKNLVAYIDASNDQTLYLVYTPTFDDGGTGFSVGSPYWIPAPNDGFVNLVPASQASLLTDVVNRPIYLWHDSNAITGGDPANTLTVTVLYTVLDV